MSRGACPGERECGYMYSTASLVVHLASTFVLAMKCGSNEIICEPLVGYLGSSSPRMTIASETAGPEDPLDVGERCADCGRLDFLPVNCCQRWFCPKCIGAHRLNSCSSSAANDRSVIVCPMCAMGVSFKAGQDPNAVIDAHHRQGLCDPANYERVHSRKRCSAAGCREKLTSVNAYICKDCRQQTCIRHRFPESHVCVDRSLSAKRGGAAGLFKSVKSFFASL